MIKWQVGNADSHLTKHGLPFNEVARSAFESSKHSPDPIGEHVNNERFTAEIALHPDRVKSLEHRVAIGGKEFESDAKSFREQREAGRLPDRAAVNVYYRREGTTIYLIGCRLADRDEVSRLEDRTAERERLIEKQSRYVDWVTEQRQELKRQEYERDRQRNIEREERDEHE